MNVRVASLAVAAVAAAGLCVAVPAASAAPAVGARTTAAADIIYCPFKVNATLVRVRTAPKVDPNNVIKLVNSPTQTLASQNLYSGSGYTWRKAFGGYVASQYLTRVNGSCVS